MGQQVFISYSSADKAAAERVCAVLEEAGIACWMAPRNIEPGVDHPTALVEAIRSVRVLVLILTEPAAASPHILSEVGHAFNGKKRIIPLRISQKAVPDDLEYFLSMTQWLDAPEGCTEQNLKRLVEATQAALAGAPIPHLTTPPKSRRMWLAGGGLGAGVNCRGDSLCEITPTGRSQHSPTQDCRFDEPAPSHHADHFSTKELGESGRRSELRVDTSRNFHDGVLGAGQRMQGRRETNSSSGHRERFLDGADRSDNRSLQEI